MVAAFTGNRHVLTTTSPGTLVVVDENDDAVAAIADPHC
jgi:hypothetical protein